MIIVTIFIIGLALYLIQRSPLQDTVKQIIVMFGIAWVVLLVAQFFGLAHSIPYINISVGHLG